VGFFFVADKEVDNHYDLSPPTLILSKTITSEHINKGGYEAMPMNYMKTAPNLNVNNCKRDQ
jgi:hypothetical protein